MTEQGPTPVPVLLFDVETDGLLEELTQIHVLIIKLVGGISRTFSQGPNAHGTVEEGVALLLAHTRNGGIISGHNAIKFDVPAIQKLFPWFLPEPSKVWDTMVIARLIYPDLIAVDTKLMKRKVDPLPKHLFKRHSLEAWGCRLGVFKDDYRGDPDLVAKLVASEGITEELAWKVAWKERWLRWNQTMEDYCVQDVVSTEALHLKLMSKVGPEGFSLESIELECAVAHIIARQERHGFCFDKERAGKLYAELVKEKLRIEDELKVIFKPRYFRDGPVTTPSRTVRQQHEPFGHDPNNPITEGRGKDKRIVGYKFRTMDYVEDAPHQKVKLVEFNPGSRDHIAIWLRQLYGWTPQEFTSDGKPKVDETVLISLPYKEARVFYTYLTICKRLGQIAEGNEAWLRREVNGRIHGQVITNGAVTGRATHSKPNIGQVPGVRKKKDGSIAMGLEGFWGYECRSLFGVPDGKLQVGIDMSGIELRCLAHFMARYDGGAYGREVIDGDIHTANQKAAGLPTRDNAKTFIYAFLYGAGGAKLGSIVGKDAAHGDALKKRFLKGVPALSKLIEAVQERAKKGHLKGLDGRLLNVRHKHAALNTLLQSAGAILSKKWMVLFHEALAREGLTDRVHQLAWVHDEIQCECDPEVAEKVGQMAVQAIMDTGEHFAFRVPITGEYKLGRNWAETH